MKKIVLTMTLLLTGAVCTVNAQSSHWGLRAGLNFSWFGADAKDSDARIGFHAGTYYQYMAASSFAIQPELGFSLEGDNNASFTNLNLALMGKFFPTDRFAVEFGPQLGFILSDDKFVAKSVNFSLGIGGSYQVSSRVIMGIRYNPGVSKVNDFGGENFKVTNNTLQISTHLKF